MYAYPQPTPTANADALSNALPETSWCTAIDALMPRPSKNKLRTVRPEPLGATRITSTSSGGTTPVRSLYYEASDAAKFRRDCANRMSRREDQDVGVGRRGVNDERGRKTKVVE